MKYTIGDKFLLNGIESLVVFINAKGEAYLVPENDEIYESLLVLKGLVFAIIDKTGKDRQGNKAYCMSNKECGAV